MELYATIIFCAGLSAAIDSKDKPNRSREEKSRNDQIEFLVFVCEVFFMDFSPQKRSPILLVYVERFSLPVSFFGMRIAAA
jgi:hypothetical protein